MTDKKPWIPDFYARMSLLRSGWLVRLEEESSAEWQPFKLVSTLPLVTAMILNAILVGSLFWVMGVVLAGWNPIVSWIEAQLCAEAETVSSCESIKDWSGTLQPSIRWLFGLFLTLLGLLAVGSLLLAIASPGRRRNSWREAYFSEYYGIGSTIIGQTNRHELIFIGNTFTFQKIMYRLGVKSFWGYGLERAIHAKRWAWAREAQAVAALLAALLGASTSLALILWSRQVIVSATPVDVLTASRGLILDFTWQLASSIPLLEPADVFNWERPDLFKEDKVWSTMILFLKVLFFAPLLLYIGDIWATRRERGAPMSPGEGNVAARALLTSIFSDDGFPIGMVVVPWLFRRHYRIAAELLNDRGVLSQTGEIWTLHAVAEEVRRFLHERAELEEGEVR